MQDSLLVPPLDPRSGPVPGSRFLANSTYRVLVTAAGSGGSWFGKHAMSRWVADPVEDANGFSIYIRDLKSGRFWSASRQPSPGPADRDTANWIPGIFRMEREVAGIATCLEIAVVPDASMEIRRLTLTNRGSESRRIELTSCIEVVLAEPQVFASHPAFSKLFVQTEWEQSHAALLARRRPRAHGETHPSLVHALLDRSVSEYETDRVRFLGRGCSRAAPRALCTPEPLSRTCGNVLDPVVSLRCVVALAPGETRHATFALGGAPDRDGALAMLEPFRTGPAIEKTLARAKHEARSLLARLRITEDEAQYDQALAGALLYGHPGSRFNVETDAPVRGGPQDLERLGLVPQRPFVLVHAEQPAGAALLPRLRRAHRHWCELGLGIDLVVLRGAPASPDSALLDAPLDGMHILDEPTLPEDDKKLLAAWARAVVVDCLPPLHTAPRRELERAFPPLIRPATTRPTESAVSSPSVRPQGEEPTAALRHFNGIGGFSENAREYVLRLRGTGTQLQGLPPQPWINVLANEEFGTLVSETGAGATWSRNSREHRLTPWFNDPLLDPHGEALYLRDEETGLFWSPLPGPAPGNGEYEVRHGIGYSSFAHESHGLRQETRIFVPRDTPMKITTLRLQNQTARQRRLSLFAYAQLVLDDLPESYGHAISIEENRNLQALFARNHRAGEFTHALAFAALAPTDAARVVSMTCDRAFFLGAHGTPTAPAAMRLEHLDDATGSSSDPCMVQQIHIDLAPGAVIEIHLLLGEAQDALQARQLLERTFLPDAIESARRDVGAFWEQLLGGVQIETPVSELDIMVNGWLPYQTLTCRLWARSALYQSGGAFGFRDQLQDAASLVTLSPEITRSQLLLHAEHQFVEGDVLHWWHPPKGNGIRTRFADDRLWLPYLTAHYIGATGDWPVLDEPLRFLQARPLTPGEDEAYLLPEDSGDQGDLYEHCCRAIDRSLTRGVHGLPLFGSGDWNDGMNRVGHAGRGESVWMGFFLYSVLGDFLPLCERRRDSERQRLYRQHRDALRLALEESAWDGDWYLRGFYDNGHTLGSHQDDECRIDALAQAWAVLSGAAARPRAASALDAVERHLLSEADGILRLLTPPFEHTPEDPGYIKGYVPGIRENGGQYTHAALWVVRALAEFGRNERVAPLLTMLTPLWHAQNPERVATYQVEPYVVAADIYGEPPHVGRGGWTWYTGSSGWMYRVALESLLGLRWEHGDFLSLSPCVPDSWPGFRIAYRVPGETTRYAIRARNPRGRGLGVFSATLDGEPAPIVEGTARFPLRHDGAAHRIDLVLGRTEA